MGAPLNDLRSGASYRPMAEINVTPMVDVMLVLLIIFMVTMPMLVTGVAVNLPEARMARPLDPKDPITVTINLKAQIGNDAGRVVRLRGDQETAFGHVVSVLDDLSAHGLTRVAIVTEPRSPTRRLPDAASAAPGQP